MVALRSFPTHVPEQLPSTEFERAVSLAVLVAEMEERHGVQLTRQTGFKHDFAEWFTNWWPIGAGRRASETAVVEAALSSDPAYIDYTLALSAKPPLQRPVLYRRVAALDIRMHPLMKPVYAKHTRLMRTCNRVMSMRRR